MMSVAACRELRERTGLGLQRCRDALLATNADMAAAEALLREWDRPRAAIKRVPVLAAPLFAVGCREGRAAVLELVFETEFVARTAAAATFATSVVDAAMFGTPVPSVGDIKLSRGVSAAEALSDLQQAMGEYAAIRSLEVLEPGRGATAYAVIPCWPGVRCGRAAVLFATSAPIDAGAMAVVAGNREVLERALRGIGVTVTSWRVFEGGSALDVDVATASPGI